MSEMIVSVITDKLNKCKKQREEHERNVIKFTERRDSAMCRLRDEFKLDTVEEAKARLAELKSTIQGDMEELGEISGMLDSIIAKAESGD